MDKYKAESILPYNKKESKSSQVRQMFDTIAPTYDMLNRMMTFGIDKQWRRAAMKRLAAYRPKTILDIATGTGDLPLLMEKMFSPESITGIDLSEGMLNIARKKIDEYHLNDKIKFFSARTVSHCHLQIIHSMRLRYLSAFAILNIWKKDIPRCIGY